MKQSDRLFLAIEEALFSFRERNGHDPFAILLERGAYDIVTEARKEVIIPKGKNDNGKEKLFGILVKRVASPGFGFYLSERYGAIGVGRATNETD
jgi:hypothetical protein